MKKIFYLTLLFFWFTAQCYGQNLTLIPLKIHLLTSDNNAKLANLKTELFFLNQAYNKANVGFYIAEVRMGSSQFIADPVSAPNILPFLSAQGTEHSTSSINVYILQTLGTIGGQSTFPFGDESMNITYSNRVLINAGGLAFNNRKFVLAHELGHYFGLWHTFHGISEPHCPTPTTCYTDDYLNNDFILDTPIDFFGKLNSDWTSSNNNTYYKSNSPRNNIMSYWAADDSASMATFDNKVSEMTNFTPLQLETISNYVPRRKNSATGKEYTLNASGQISSSPTISAEISAVDYPNLSNEEEVYLINIGNIPQASYALKSVIIERNLNNIGYYPIKMTDGTQVYDYITGRIESLSYRARFNNSSVYSEEFPIRRLPATGVGDLSVSYDLVSPIPLIQNEYPNSFKVKVTNTTSNVWTGNLYLSLSTTNDDVNNGVGLVTLTNTTIQPYSSIYLDRGVQARITSPKGQYYLKVFNSDGYLDSTPISIMDPPVTNNGGTISISPINTTFNFSNTNVGETIWQTFRVTNTSPTRVLTCDYGVTGNVFSSLAIPSTFTLNPNEYIDIPISFKPTAAQYYTGRFIVNGNFDNLTMSKTLTGTGITQLATLTTDVLLGTDITLIDTKVGEYREASVTLTNTSTTDFTGTYDLDNSVFQGRVTNQTGNTISVPAGQSRAIIIRFIPTDNGLTLGRLTIYGNATNTPIGFTIRAIGYGAATGACVSVSTLRITSNVDVSWTGTREFGRFTLTNNSSSKIATVHRLQFSGNDASKFSLSPNITNTTLNPNQSQEFIVYLTSNTPQGSYQGKVIVGVQDAGWDCAYYNIDLIGTAVQSVVNTPVLVYPENNKIHSYAGGYRFYIAFDILKKNIGASATYQLYLQDLTDNSVVYNHLNLGSFTGYGPDERCGWRSPSYPNEVTKSGHNYKWYIRAVNATNPNDFKDSDVRYFSVEAPPVCKYPAVSVTDILNTSATASWQPVEGGLSYKTRIKFLSGFIVDEPSAGTPNLNKTLNFLIPNTYYTIEVSSQCNLNQQIDLYTHSSYSPPLLFKTKPTPCTNIASIFPSTAQETCFGGSMQFNTNTVATSYQWYKDDLTINGATQSSYLALNTGTYKVKVITSDGCEFYSNSVAFTYKTQVSAPSVTSTTVNARQTATLTASGCTGTVNWYNVATGGSSLATGSTFTTTLNNTTTYFAECTSNNCTSTTRGSGTITVNTVSPITLGTLSSTNYCVGNNISVPFTTTLPAGTVCTATLKKGTTIINTSTVTVGNISGFPYTVSLLIPYSTNFVYGADYTVQVTAGTNSSSVSPNLTIGTINPSQVTDINGVSLNYNDYLCMGQTKNYYATVTDIWGNVINTNINYQWKKNNVNIGTNTNSLAVTQSGLYTFVATQAGCTSTPNTINLTVSSSATASSSSRAYGDEVSCVGSTKRIDALYYSNTATYQWQKDGVNIAGATNRYYDATTSGLYRANIVDGTCSGIISDRQLTFGSGLLANITVSTGNDTTICGSQTKYINATNSSLNPTQYSFQWQKDGVNITGETNSSYAATQAGVYSVTYSQGTCSSTSRGLTILNSALAQKPVITAGNITNICNGNIILNQNINGNNSYIYGTWYKDGVVIPNTNSYYYSASTSGTYKMVSGTGTCANESNTVTVSIGSTFTPKIYVPSYYKSNLCGTNDYLYIYFDNQNISGGTYTFQWQKNGVNIAGATNTLLYVNSIGNYTLIVSNGSCLGTSNIINIANSTAIANISASENNIYCTNKEIRLDLKGANTYFYSPIVWKRDGVVVNGETSSFLYTNQAGAYTATYNQSGCSGTSSTFNLNIGYPSFVTQYPTSINNGQTANLVVLGCVGTVNWYDVATGGTPIGTNAMFTTPPLNASTSYYSNCSINGCMNPYRTVIPIIVNCTNLYSLKTGNWNDISVWSCGRIPTSADVITIKPTHFITIPAAYIANAKNVVFEGGKIIEAANTSKLCLKCP